MATADDVEIILGLCALKLDRLRIVSKERLPDALPFMPGMRPFQHLFAELGTMLMRGNQPEALNAASELAGARRDGSEFAAARITRIDHLDRCARRAAALNEPNPDDKVRELARKVVAQVPPERLPIVRNPWQPTEREVPEPTVEDVDLDDDDAFDDDGKLGAPIRAAPSMVPNMPERTPRRTPRRTPGQASAAVPAQASAIPGRPRRPAPTTGKLAGKQRNMRKAEITAFFWHIVKGGGKFATPEAFVAELRKQCNDRDPLDPGDVPGAELGKLLRLTIERKDKIEAATTAKFIEEGWRLKGYRFRIRTIAPCDMTPDEVAKLYQRRRNDERIVRRRTERLEAKMQTTEQPTTLATYAAYTDWQKQNIKAQLQAIFDALPANGEERNIAEMMAAVRHHPSWSAYADKPPNVFREAINKKINILLASGRIANRFEPNPRGGKPLRMVRRAKRPANGPNIDNDLPL
jgi:hypothetical protein